MNEVHKNIGGATESRKWQLSLVTASLWSAEKGRFRCSKIIFIMKVKVSVIMKFKNFELEKNWLIIT